jgi:hypothetical protein
MAAAFAAALPPVGTTAEDQIGFCLGDTEPPVRPAVLANGMMDFKYAWPLSTTH